MRVYSEPKLVDGLLDFSNTEVKLSTPLTTLDDVVLYLFDRGDVRTIEQTAYTRNGFRLWRVTLADYDDPTKSIVYDVTFE